MEAEVKMTFDQALDDLKLAISNKQGNIPAKEVTVKRRLAEEIQETRLSDLYLEIYKDCFPYGKPANIDLLTELANEGMTKRTPLTSKYWVKKLEAELGC